MTRQQFIDDVTDFSELIDFCYEFDCSYCEYVRNGDDYDQYVRDCIYEWDSSWEDLRDWLDSLPSIGNYDYIDTDDFNVLDDYDFERYKSDVLEWVDRNGLWDDPDEDDEAVDRRDTCDPYASYLFEGPVQEPENPLAGTVLDLLAV